MHPTGQRSHHLSVGEVEGKGLLIFGVELLPLEETRCGDKTATLLEGLAVSGRLRDGFSSSIDRGERFEAGEVFCEERDEAPAYLY
jgi:hypothetical protein